MADEKVKTVADQRIDLRKLNLNPVRATEKDLALRDSSLKKNTAFVRKIKTFSEAQLASVLSDIKSLNLSKYISEICQAIVEAKFKLSDVNSLVQVCSRLHIEYADFAQCLLDNFQKSISTQSGNPAKARVDLRLTAELLLSGVFPLKEGFQVIKQFVQEMCNQSQQSLSSIISLCKGCGEELLALGTPGLEIYIPIDKQKTLQTMVREYFKSIGRYATREHGDLCSLQKQHRNAVQNKGAAPPELSEKLENSQITFTKLTSSLEQLAAMLGETPPQFSEPEEPPELEGIVQGVSQDSELAEEPLWEDSDAQAFYENLPDLKAIMPAILKDNVKEDKDGEGEHEKSTSPAPDGDGENDEDVEVKAEKEMMKVETKPQLDSFLKDLLHCVNRDTIDQMAEKFCFNLNTRTNRYKLTRALFLVPRTRLDLLPFFGRLVAILKPIMADVGEELCTLLLKDFSYQLRKKDQMNIETKVKTVRFLAELTKFRVLPASEALHCLKRLIQDFSHHTIDMSCHLVECCGRFLFLQSVSHGQTRALVDQMLRKRTVQNLDPRHQQMVDNACAVVTSITAPRAPINVVKKPPLERYLRKLLYQELTKHTVDKIVHQLRKLNWNDEYQMNLALSLLTKPHELRYYNIRALANVVAELATYQDGIGPRVLDSVIEEIRLGMEINDPKFNQSRVAAVHYLGELYDYRLSESALIFSVLYSLITFGAGTPLDPPENVFRLRLVCVLLDTCAVYFDKASSKKRLDTYLHFLLLYFWNKRENFGEGFPVTVELLLRESIQPLRPKFQWPKTLEAAQAAVEKLLSQAVISKAQDKDSQNNNVPNDAGDQAYDSEGLSDIGEEEEDENDDDFDEDDETESEENKEPAEVVVDEFEAEFEADFEEMVSDSINQRAHDKIVPQVKEIMVPQMNNQKVATPAATTTTTQNGAAPSNFMILMRSQNKNKPQLKHIELGDDNELALKIAQTQKREREEKLRMKQLTLTMNMRQEEESWHDDAPDGHLVGPERKFQHPKGAPDADLIFGSSSRRK